VNKRALLLSAILLAIPQAKASDFEFAAQANALCRTIIDARDFVAFKAAQDMSLDLTLAQVRGDSPPAVVGAGMLSRLFHSVNADLAAAIERLQDLTPSPELDAFLTYGRSRIEINDALIGFLADLDGWQWMPLNGLDTSRYNYIRGMADLGFTDRDCTYVFGSLGNPPESADFITAVAPTCNDAYDRLVQTDIEQWRELNLKAMVAAMQDRAQDPDAVPALRKLAATWQEVADAFRLVDSKIEDKPPRWEQVVSILYDRARIFGDRADALEYGDEDAIDQAFDNRIETPDFEQVGLRETSCMGLTTLM
jgi:hypothetical protein